VTSASSATSNSSARTTRLKAVWGTATSAKSRLTSGDATAPAFRALVTG
jgi:hypothetical protein